MKKSFHPVGNCMFKVNNKNIRTRWEICLKLTIKTPERRQWRFSGVFIVNFEHISHLVLVLLLLTLSRKMPAFMFLFLIIWKGWIEYKLYKFKFLMETALLSKVYLQPKKKPGRTFIKFENDISLTPRAINNLKIIKKFFVILSSGSKYLMKGVSMSIKLLLLSNKNEIALKISCISVCLKRRQYTLAVISGKQIWIKQITTFTLRPGRHMNIQSTFDFGRASTE